MATMTDQTRNGEREPHRGYMAVGARYYTPTIGAIIGWASEMTWTGSKYDRKLQYDGLVFLTMEAARDKSYAIGEALAAQGGSDG